MSRMALISLILAFGIFVYAFQSFSAEKILTKVLIRVVSRDAKVIGSGLGGASIRIAKEINE